ncbi:MAG TPA: DUF3093 domain-containing protein [Pseudolysinimonas sp.]|nr:DUF3093 domain-containing protein [Pseudolysinimonas sp.]
MRYRERLWPAVWVFVATALVIPASLLVFLPISPLAGVAVAIGLYAAIVLILILTTPTIELDDETFRAGRARIPRNLISRATAFSGAEAMAERGTRLDARAWLLVRGWLPDVVRVELNDPADPTPYWLVASRHSRELAEELNRRAH